MSNGCRVSIVDLKYVSVDLIETYFPSDNIYFVLLLSLITVSRYRGKSKKKLSMENRIDLALAYAPDLVTYLAEREVINNDTADQLLQTLKDKEDELISILTAYVYAAGGLRVKMDNKERRKNSSKCTIL